jgi:hypothetical protein
VRLVLVGTRKGLFLIREGELQDPRSGALYTASNNWVYGGVVQSEDGGETWERSDAIELPGTT